MASITYIVAYFFVNYFHFLRRNVDVEAQTNDESAIDDKLQTATSSSSTLGRRPQRRGRIEKGRTHKVVIPFLHSPHPTPFYPT